MPVHVFASVISTEGRCVPGVVSASTDFADVAGRAVALARSLFFAVDRKKTLIVVLSALLGLQSSAAIGECSHFRQVNATLE